MGRKKYVGQQLLDAFWNKVDKRSNDDCWSWKPSKGKPWHCTFSRHGGAHRFSMEIFLGRKLKIGEWVLHKCDNPNCVNPYHLFIGTAADNSRDMTNKNRQTKGTDSPLSKLTIAKVRLIRKLYATGNWSFRKLGIRFKVNYTLIFRIVHCKNWSHVT